MTPKTQLFLSNLLFMVSVSARFIGTEEDDKITYLPATAEQKEYIAASLCDESLGYYFNYSDDAIHKCIEDFGWHMDQDVSGLQVRCRSGTRVTLEVPTDNFYQIVLLVPHPNDNDTYSVIYNILNPNSKFTDGLKLAPGTNYSAYSAVLNRNGTPLVWHQEGAIQEWEAPARRDYNVQIEFTTTTESIDGLFSWNRTGELDACFELDTSCQNSYFPTKKIWPGSPPKEKIENLPPNELCNMSLRGLYGTTEVFFKTPELKSSDEVHIEKIPDEAHLDKVSEKVVSDVVTDETHSDIVPDEVHSDKFVEELSSGEASAEKSSLIANAITEKPEFKWVEVVYLEAVEDGDKWTVHVSWPKPLVTPDSYNVTLWAEVIISTIVPGSAVQAELKGVTGSGFYNVSVFAIKGQEVAHNSGRAPFPSRSATGVGAGVVRWAAAAGGAWATAALAAVLYWLRTCRANMIPPAKQKPSLESKQIDNPCVETAPVEPPPVADAWEIKPERLTRHEVIGEGAFGVVRRGTLAPLGKEVAIKMLKDFPSVDEMRAFRVEMELMKSVGAHPHVVSLVGCCSARQPAIVAEYCSRGDLLNFLRCSWDVMMSKRNANYYNNNINTSDYRNDLFKYKMPQEHSRLVVNKLYDLQGVGDTELTSLDLLSFCRQIVMGMEFLALNKVVHRDLAARNILVTGDRTLKIADFGLSRDVYEENQYKQKGNGKMPVKWMALESLTRRIYTTQSDVWSFGVVVWEVVTVGGAPYAGVAAARLPRLLRAGYRMPRPPNCSPQLYELMRSCWATRPRDRPSFAELHARLDELLNSASTVQYLSLELDDEPPPTPRAHRYLRLILRAKRNWTRGESYERPLKAPHNHYTSTPVTYKTPI